MMHSKQASVSRKRRHGNFKKKIVPYLYLSPWLAGFALLQLTPFLSSLYYSFTNYRLLRDGINWVGLQNYITLFTMDPDFKKSLGVTFLYALIVVPAKLIMALAIALLLNSKVKFVNFYRTAYYLPSIMGASIAISALWKLLFMKEGVLNNMLANFGVPAVDWLGMPGTALVVLSLLQVWQFGSSMITFLAALKQVPNELYEAALVDGATVIQRFFSITLPMITPILLFNTIMQTNNAIQVFTSSFIITNGGPMKSTYVLGMKLYDEAFGHFKMGYASAISWVMFAIVFVLTFILMRSSKHWVYYEDGGEF